jgi:hypothetical protein|tara:strand:+ start:234 stop:647 length:414 start_codon:yes stop_codon:yes gene_type:complete
MKSFVCLLFASVLVGCNTPSLEFRGVAPVTIAVNGSTFDVRVKDLRAQAIRTNMQYAPRMGPIAGRAKAAIEEVSGCKVSQVGGDQALISAVLNCGKVPPPPKPVGLDYECYSVGGLGIVDRYLSDLVLDCTPIQRP